LTEPVHKICACNTNTDDGNFHIAVIRYRCSNKNIDLHWKDFKNPDTIR
jgi:hypothetical protein